MKKRILFTFISVCCIIYILPLSIFANGSETYNLSDILNKDFSINSGDYINIESTSGTYNCNAYTGIYFYIAPSNYSSDNYSNEHFHIYNKGYGVGLAYYGVEKNFRMPNSDSDWTCSGNICANSYTVDYIMVSTKNNLLVVFKAKPIEYEVKVNYGKTGKANAEKDAIVCITADNPPLGKQFKEWTGTDGITFTDNTSKTSSTAKFIMPAKQVSLTAIYEDIQKVLYSVIVNNGISDKAKAEKDDKVIITAYYPPAGKQFEKWTGTDGIIFTDNTSASSSTAKFIMPRKAVTVTANFEEIPTSTPTPTPSQAPTPAGNTSVITTDSTPTITSTDKVIDLISKSQGNDTIKTHGNNDVRISSNILTKLKDNMSKLCISNSWYTWFIDGKTVKNPADINLTCIKEENKKMEDVISFKIVYNGDFPFEAKLKVDLPGYINESTEVYLYKIVDGKRIFQSSARTSGYSATFERNSASEYVVSTVKPSELSAGEGAFENVTPLRVG